MSDVEENETESLEKNGRYPGVGRAPYLGFLAVFYVCLGALVVFEEAESTYLLISAVVLIVAFFILSGFRLQNIGYSPVWVLALLIPIFNIFVNVGCAAYPPGYKLHKKLDTASYVIAAVILSLIVAGYVL